MADIVSISEARADEFVQFFYTSFDQQRQNLVNSYRENSAIVWNGNALNPQGYFDFLGQLPASQHERHVHDCQPIPATMNARGRCGILINTSGTVRYGGAPKRNFSQTFLLMPNDTDEISYYIQSDNFRFV